MFCFFENSPGTAYLKAIRVTFVTSLLRDPKYFCEIIS